MASPQTEDGYTRIANELLEALYRTHLGGSQTQVLFAIIRLTYGWHKTTDWISVSQLMDATGLPERTVQWALRQLRDKHIILRDYGQTSIQKDYTQWQGCKNQQGARISRVQESVPKGCKNHAKNVPSLAPTKDKRYKDREGAPAQIVTSFKTHPAIDAYAELTGKRPKKGTLQYDTIVQSVTDNQQKIELWKEAIRAWLLCDNKPTNVSGILDWFRTGKRDNRSGTIHGGNPGVERPLTAEEEAWKAYAISVKQRIASQPDGPSTV